jgi:hypothetical protein
VPVLPSWLAEPLWVQFEALLPERPIYDPAHPLGCHRLARAVWDADAGAMTCVITSPNSSARPVRSRSI